MKNQNVLSSFIFVLIIAMSSCGNKSTTPENQPEATAQAAVDTTAASQPMASVYQCPMKCEGEKTYDAMGKCPKCGMDLEMVEKHEGHEH